MSEPTSKSVDLLSAITAEQISASDLAYVADVSETDPENFNRKATLAALAEWIAAQINVMTTAGDLIVGGTSGAPARLAKGSDGQVLKVVAGALAWAAESVGLANPMTTAGDLIVGGSSGTPARLAKGTDGQVLKVVSGNLAWATDETGGGGGMTNPMTTAQDLIVGGTSGAPARLAAGSDGQVLKVVSGVLAWAADVGFANPMTTAGDLILGGSSGAPGRLAVGSEGKVLKVVSGAPAWADDATGSASGGPQSSASITSDVDLDSAIANGGLILVDGSSDTIEITIRPNASYSYASNWHFWIVATDTTNPVTLQRGSGVSLIENNTDANLTLTLGVVYHVWRQGTDTWRVISKG